MRVDNGMIVLNQMFANLSGNVWFNQKVYFDSFSTCFNLSIIRNNSTNGGDGMAFVIQVKKSLLFTLLTKKFFH